MVIDTGVVISALLKKEGTSRSALSAALNHWTPILSPGTINELNEVLDRSKFTSLISPETKVSILELILERAEWIEPTSEVTACRDKSDNMFLALALDGKADCIISRDSDLLVLHPFQNIPILTPTDFLKLFGSK